MNKELLLTTAIVAALCTVAVANSSVRQSQQLAAETAALYDLLAGRAQSCAYEMPSTLEFFGGELRTTEQKRVSNRCWSDYCHRSWVGRVDLVMFRPHVHSIRYQRSIAEIEGQHIDSADHALNSMTYSPRVCIGRQGECWGLLTRFWYMGDSNLFHEPYNGLANGDLRTGTASNSIKMYTIDLELYRRLNLHCGEMNLGVGVRHGSIELRSMATHGLFQDTPNFDYTSMAFTRGQIDATGLTIGLDGRCPIWPCHDVSMFWGVRGSALWGAYNSQAVAHTIISDPAAVIVNDYSKSNETLFIGEIQIGVAWERRLSCLPANLFVKLAAEYQYWGADNAPIWNGAFATVPSGQAASSQYDVSSPNVSLLGLNVGIGLTWGGRCSH